MNHLKDPIFQITIKDFLDSYIFNVKQVMKCCVGFLALDRRAIPYWDNNSVEYREEIRVQITMNRPGVQLSWPEKAITEGYCASS